MPDATPNPVRRTVWPWDAPPSAPADARAALRRKAFIQGLVLAIVAVAVFFAFPHHDVAFTLLSILAGLNLLLGMLAPAAFGAVDRAMHRAGQVAGQAVTWLLLVPFYYLFFTPARLVLALRGKDPMHRRFPGTEPTYWVARKPVSGPDDYRKQF